MATTQGMCTNCGSLVIFDDRDENCECVFCHCVFPASEAVELLANPAGHEFKNEKFEVQEGGKHYYATPMQPDIVSKAVQRDKVSKAKSEDLKIKPNEFELSPNDVKAPANMVIAIVAAAVVCVGIILAIAWPMYNTRTSLTDAMVSKLDTVFEDQAKVDLSLNDDGYATGYCISGKTCQNLKVETSDEISEDAAQKIFDNYCELRAAEGGDKASSSKEVTVAIYTPTTIYTVTADGVTVSKAD